MSSSLDRQELARRREEARRRARRQASGHFIQMAVWCAMIAAGGIALMRGGDPWGALLVLAAVGGVLYALWVLGDRRENAHRRPRRWRQRRARRDDG